MQVLGQQDATLADHQAPGRDGHLGVAALGVLKGLQDVLSIHDPRLDLLPKPLSFKGFPGGDAVRRVIGVRDGDMQDARIAKLRQALDATLLGP